MALVIGPRFTIRNIEPADVRTAPPAQRRAFWNACSAFVAMAKEIELRNGLDKDGNPLAALAKYTVEHRESAMGAANPFAPPLQPAHGLSRTRSLFVAQPTSRLDGVICFWGYDAVTAESWGKMLAIHRTGSAKLPPRDVIGLSKPSVAEVKKAAAAWWTDYVKSAGAVPIPEFAPELEPTPPPKFRVERVPKYKPKFPERAVPKEPHRISQIRINGHTYTMQSGSAAGVRRGIANKSFTGFGKVIRGPDGKIIKVGIDELTTPTTGKFRSAQAALAKRGGGPAGPAATAATPPPKPTPKPATVKPKIAKPKVQGATQYVQAPAGGAISDVTGEFYKGGQWMPVHGMSSGLGKPPSVPKGTGGTPPKAKEGGQKREPYAPRPPKTPEEIHRDELWTEIKAGPLGEMIWMPDRPGSLAKYTLKIEPFKEWIERTGGQYLAQTQAVAEEVYIKSEMAMYAENVNKRQGLSLEEIEKRLREYLTEYGEAEGHYLKRLRKKYPEAPKALATLKEVVKTDEVAGLHAVHQAMGGLAAAKKNQE